MVTKFEMRRHYVNKELKRLTIGTHISNKARTKLMENLWKEAKKKYP